MAQNSTDAAAAVVVSVIPASGEVPAAGSDNGSSGHALPLPPIFQTPFRPDLIHKAFVHLSSHSFQPQGRHPTAGMDVVADTNDPPTGRGIARIARARGGGGRRRGEGAEVASTRGGRQAHPPAAEKAIYKKLNKKEGRLAFCSAVAATASRRIVESRGHRVAGYADGMKGGFPIVIEDDIGQHATAREALALVEKLGLADDVERLRGRKARSGRPSLRGRSKKVGKSVLFVVAGDGNVPLKSAVGALPGVEARGVSELSVLDLAPGSDPIRLTVFTRSAVEQLGGIRSAHLDVMGMMPGGGNTKGRRSDQHLQDDMHTDAGDEPAGDDEPREAELK